MTELMKEASVTAIRGAENFFFFPLANKKPQRNFEQRDDLISCIYYKFLSSGKISVDVSGKAKMVKNTCTTLAVGWKMDTCHGEEIE